MTDLDLGEKNSEAKRRCTRRKAGLVTGCAILAGVRGGEAADQKGKSKRGEEMQKDEQGEEGAVDVAAAERFAAAIPAGWIGAGGSRETRNQSGM